MTGLFTNTIAEATSGSGITFSNDIVPATPLSNRNMIINGAMNVYQRGSLSITQSNNGGFALDRFGYEQNTNMGQWEGTMSQHTMSSADYNTTGFANALKLLTGTHETAVGADEYARIHTKLESQDIKHLQYGTASAKTTTLSFWVNSSVAGTYGITMYSQCSQARTINKTYTINTADTWEKKTLTIVGDTGQAHNDDNALGMMIVWSLASGSNYDGVNSTSWANYSTTNLNGGHAQDGVITTSSATFYLTGVQWELGSVATPFEHRSYGDELLRCSRYYHKHHSGADASGGAGNNDLYQNYLNIIWYSSVNARGLYHHPVPMRVNPSFSASGNFQTITGTSLSDSDFSSGDYGGTPVYSVRVNKSGNTTYYGTTVRSNNDATAYFAWDAEL